MNLRVESLHFLNNLSKFKMKEDENQSTSKSILWSKFLNQGKK